MRSWERSLKRRNRSARTIESYAYSFHRISEWADGASILDLDRADIEDFIDDRMEEVAAATVRQECKHLKLLWKWLLKEELIVIDPWKGIELPQATDNPPRVPTVQEVAAMIKACSGKEYNDRRDKACLMLLATLGSPRLSELTAMTVSDVDFSSDLISIPAGKTFGRSLPASDATWRAFELFIRARAAHRLADSPMLWLGLKGPLGRNGIAQIINRRARQAGITWKVHPHSFRHYVTDRADQENLPERLLEPLMGWMPGSQQSRVYGRSSRARRAIEAARAVAERI
ncbi:MAG: tyrosine-type recombinase/integrase [Actinoplanes sp.]